MDPSREEKKGADECGIREMKNFGLLPTCRNRRDVALEKTRIVIDYLDLADVDPQDQRRLIRNREELAQELFDVFYQMEDNKLSLWAMTVTFIIMLFWTGLIYYAATSSSRLTPVYRPFDLPGNNLSQLDLPENNSSLRDSFVNNLTEFPFDLPENNLTEFSFDLRGNNLTRPDLPENNSLIHDSFAFD